MSFIAYWNGAYSSNGASNLQYCYKGKFGNLAVKDTADWSQVANKPATATRWPSWGEVTGKPDLKSWSETKSYIDNKAVSSGGVDSLPIGTELISYDGNNIFGDKFLKEDGSYFKKDDVQINLGAVREFDVKTTTITIDLNTYDTSTIVYFDGYYYIRKLSYYNWARSTSLTGNFYDYTPLDGCATYIGNGAFSYLYGGNAKTVIINGKTYSHGAFSYSGGYFLTLTGITSDFSSYLSTDVSYNNYYKPCKNNPDYLYKSNSGLLQIVKLSTAKVVAQAENESMDDIDEFCYDESKNIGAAVLNSRGSDDTKAYIVDFSKKSIIYKTTIYNSSTGNNYINMIGSIIVYSGSQNTYCSIYDYNIKKEEIVSNFRENYKYHNPLVVNNNLCISSSLISSDVISTNLLTLIVFGYEGYDSTKYYQIKNNPGGFVKVK